MKPEALSESFSDVGRAYKSYFILQNKIKNCVILEVKEKLEVIPDTNPSDFTEEEIGLRVMFPVTPLA